MDNTESIQPGGFDLEVGRVKPVVKHLAARIDSTGGARIDGEYEVRVSHEVASESPQRRPLVSRRPGKPGRPRVTEVGGQRHMGMSLEPHSQQQCRERRRGGEYRCGFLAVDQVPPDDRTEWQPADLRIREENVIQQPRTGTKALRKRRRHLPGSRADEVEQPVRISALGSVDSCRFEVFEQLRIVVVVGNRLHGQYQWLPARFGQELAEFRHPHDTGKPQRRSVVGDDEQPAHQMVKGIPNAQFLIPNECSNDATNNGRVLLGAIYWPCASVPDDGVED